MQCLDQLDAVTKVRYEKKLSILNSLGIPICIHGVIVARLGQIHCILPFALKLYLTCHLPITFANSLDPDQARHSVQA